MAPPEPAGPGRVRLWLATGLGAGYAPWMPGTFGSLPGVLLAWLLWTLGGGTAQVLGTLSVVALGFATAGGAARRLGGEDPGPVVIDEIAGQMVTLLLLAPTATTLLAGFVLFRLADIVKPFPARRLEALPGASGIMADDLAAAVYAHLALRLVLQLAPI